MRLKNLTPIQQKYYHDEEHRFIVVSAGRRSRKTLIGKRKLLNRAMSNENNRYFYGAPTRDQAKSIFWDTLKRDTYYLRSCEPSETKLMVKLKNGTEIYVIGLDKPQRIEGQPWNGCHITEFADIKKEAWDANIRPVLADTQGWAILDGVPEAGNAFYRDLCKYACGGIIPKTDHYHGAFGENPEDPQWCFYSWFSSDVLLPSEIESLKRNTDPFTYRQEFEGSHETRGGLAYYCFDNTLSINHTFKYDPEKPIIYGKDFNWNPMTSVLAQEYVEDNVLKVCIFDEGHYMNCDTQGGCEKDIEKYKDCSFWEIYPDPACQYRAGHGSEKGVAGITDKKIIENTFKAYNKNFKIYIKHNQTRIDGLNCTNMMFLNAAKYRRLTITENCVHLKRDLESINRDDFIMGGNAIPDNLGHISDALRYICQKRYPILRAA